MKKLIICAVFALFLFSSFNAFAGNQPMEPEPPIATTPRPKDNTGQSKSPDPNLVAIADAIERNDIKSFTHSKYGVVKIEAPYDGTAEWFDETNYLKISFELEGIIITDFKLNGIISNYDTFRIRESSTGQWTKEIPIHSSGVLEKTRTRIKQVYSDIANVALIGLQNEYAGINPKVEKILDDLEYNETPNEFDPSSEIGKPWR